MGIWEWDVYEVGQLWQSKLLKSAGLQGSTLPGHCMATGFGSFELLTPWPTTERAEPLPTCIIEIPCILSP